MAADVAADVHRSDLALQELHRGENGPLRTTRAEAWRTSGQEPRERLHLFRGLAPRLAHGTRVRRAVQKRRRLEKPRRVTPQERLGTALEHLAGVLARAREHLLPDHLGG